LLLYSLHEAMTAILAKASREAQDATWTQLTSSPPKPDGCRWRFLLGAKALSKTSAFLEDLQRHHILSPWLEFIAVLGGSIFGAYLAVRVELASINLRQL
jgi:hypothetical protein